MDGGERALRFCAAGRSSAGGYLEGVNRARRPLWSCPKCSRQFANRNQSHACGNYDLDSHFVGKHDQVRATFDKIVEVAGRNGPLTVLPEKTRIALQVRMSFAAFSPRTQWLDGHVVLARRLENPRFRKIATYSPRNHVHVFRLFGPDEVDEEVAGWLSEAYRVGQQAHLG